jgi:DNA-binding winged helix-turn-helix (wHTH) protein
MSSPQWRFADFRLDLANACLWRGAEAITLTPKAFEVLHYLVTHPNRLVTKDMLLDVVWPETAVSDAVVRIAIGELRRALGDTVRAPRFIATVPRRGYRFLASVTQATPPDTVSPASSAPLPAPVLSLPASAGCRVRPTSTPLVGREAVLVRLHTALAQARQGLRQFLFLMGEPGIGKTAVVEAFAAQLTTDPTVQVASGQCVEHYGLGEPYLPVLEALGQLCRGPAGARLASLLRQQAPTWLVQMPWLLTAADRDHLQQELQGTTRERMLREFAEVLETFTAETPLVLVLEDLHWSDHATLDLVSLLARRRAPAQFLLLGTFRPVETIVHSHPLRTVAQDLQREGRGLALPLAPLNVEAVTAYLAARFPGPRLPGALARWLCEHTDGNALFLVTMVSALVERGVLTEHTGYWHLQQTLDAVELGVPEGVRPLLEQQLERLPAEMQEVLEVASVAGVTFAAAAVVAGLEAPAAEIETRCEALTRYQVLQSVGLTQWPDGTVTTHYTFTHALYQQTAYERMGVVRRIQLHSRLGIRLEAAYGARAGEIAAELAVHFEHGRDYHRAVQYLQQAGENAMRRCANQEAIRLLTKGLELLTTLPDTPERSRQELSLQSTLGPALIATRGYAAPDVIQTYDRARDLSRRLGDTLQLFVALRGLQTFHAVRAELQMAAALAEELLLLAQRQNDPTLLVFAHLSLGSTLFHCGAFVQARVHLEQGMALNISPLEHAPAFLYGHSAGVVCISWAALALWLLGYPEQALQRGHGSSSGSAAVSCLAGGGVWAGETGRSGTGDS